MKYFIPVASDFISDREVKLIIKQNDEFLKRLNCKQIVNDQLIEHEQICYLIITYGLG